MEIIPITGLIESNPLANSPRPLFFNKPIRIFASGTANTALRKLLENCCSCSTSLKSFATSFAGHPCSGV